MFGSKNESELDIRQKLAAIDKALIETSKAQVEIDKLTIDIHKTVTETKLLDRKYRWYPFVMLFGAFTAGGAFMSALHYFF